ncbi:MAG TPA: ATP-grasp domain-containing protein [Micromonosporaceae bacterium]|nr:ATP-grasp domain-containing protein [Micromonosporaceae bacterium]
MELLLIGAGVQGTPYVSAARRLGARVRLVETERQLTRLAGEVDEAIITPGETDEDWAAAACAAAVRRRPDGVLGFNEPQVLAAALVQDELGLPGPGLRAAVISRNKGLQRGRFRAAGVPQPEHLLVDDLAAARGWALARLPVVVKPLSLAGSAGVVQVADPAGYDRLAVARAGQRLLVEEQVTGPEYSWEGLVRDGTVLFGNVTEKETLGPPGFVEVGHRAGYRFAPEPQAAVDAMVRSVLAAMGVGSGIVHLELVLTGTGPVLIEIAVRTPGDYLMDVVSLTTGVDLYDAVLRIALGLPLEDPLGPPAPVAYAASWMVTADPGRIVEVSGLDEVRRQPHVARARLRRSLGDVVAPVRSSADRIGHVLVSAPTPAERDAALEFARRHLRVTTQPQSTDGDTGGRGPAEAARRPVRGRGGV